ncbi:class I SAM-dependent DNA methyltransferase, partial [Myxococcus sp. AM001]|nr:class I SAM-dependent DNA methyltransferase [Myxococcus sp. AM001]
RQQIQAGQAQRAGLVSTNSIRGGANRKVLDAIAGQLTIFNAWSDESWVNDGAAVRVSLVSFAKQGPMPGILLDGNLVGKINADLSHTESGEHGLDLTRAKKLPENADASFIGTQKNGPFDFPGEIAR